ncbi:MAG: dihydroxyacetone kinase subunit L [Eubacterium sp.]|nr:dihydroxyacetone kinase subunit L [Eubacterium sp.]
MADAKKVLEIIKKMSKDIEDNKDFLTELDNIIADGDHGINMARGFAAVEEVLPGLEDKDIATILKQVGMKLLSTVGGASGPLYGTAFMKAGAAAAGKDDVNMDDFFVMLDAAIDGVQKRGKAVVGEKTMIDSMIPARDAMKESYAADQDAKKAFEAGIKAAEDGIEYTKTIIATKGRASYIGERSIGHQDPGATSFTIMLKDIAEFV